MLRCRGAFDAERITVVVAQRPGEPLAGALLADKA
jgi:hypothetical protein